tara:strand:+ start:12296 stop:12784 length:489 start_codon:yes stop_codon:yes gene_type:complete
LSNKIYKKFNFSVVSNSRIWSKRVKNTKSIINLALKDYKYYTNKSCKYYDITFLLTDDKHIKKLNKKYKNTNKTTNVLTFTNYHIINDNQKIRYSNIAISGDRIKEESRKLNLNFYEHFTHIVIHSLLHTNNYKHENERDFQKMKKKEILILKKFNIRNPYI